MLPLRGLTESQVGMLVEQIAGEPAGSEVVRTVHRATNGNPLYIDSITHLLVAEERLHLDDDDDGESDGTAAAAVAAEHARRHPVAARRISTTSRVRCCASPP